MKSTENKKTPSEIESLKHNWKCDPCWDIEHTEGFEEHFEELKQFREEYEKNQTKEYEDELEKKAVRLGISGKLDLVRYLNSLEDKIEKLTERI